MPAPGKGRYTTYVPIGTPRNALLNKLFNEKAGDAATLYGDKYQTDNLKAAAAASARATAPVVNGVGGLIPSDGLQRGDLGMFPDGVRLGYGDAPDLTKVEVSSDAKPGNPANPYMPNIASPGPGKFKHEVGSPISVEDLAAAEGSTGGPNHLAGYTPGAPGTSTTSPSSTSPTVGVSPFAKDELKAGSST